jgi:hypothetical protein
MDGGEGGMVGLLLGLTVMRKGRKRFEENVTGYSDCTPTCATPNMTTAFAIESKISCGFISVFFSLYRVIIYSLL